MDPSTYMDRIRAPLLELLIEYAIGEELLPRAECTSSIDVRQFLRRILDELQERLNSQDDRKAKTKLSHQRRILSFTSEMLNTHAHEHDRETQSISLGVASSLALFIKSTGLRNSTSKKKIDSFEVELFQALFSEYAPIETNNTKDAGDSLQIEALHDKIDKLMSLLENKASEQLTEKIKNPSGDKRQKLEDLRREIEKYAAGRGRRMEGYQHLLQIRRLANLIEVNPRTLDDLQNWARTLASYEQNKDWIDRQVQRWGIEVLSIVGEPG